MLAKPLYVYLSVVLPDLQVHLLLGRHKQVLHLFIVDFKHAELHLLLQVRILVLFNSPEYFIACHWYNSKVLTVADHGIALTTSGLAIGKQTAVVATPGIVEHLLSQSFIHQILVSVIGMLLILSRNTIIV